MRKITVLMSSYNGEKYIAEQIESILHQENCCVRLIVRDDGSTDGTREILERYQKDHQLTWYADGENLGPAHSFLRLLAHAPDSDYYAFSDQDDYWLPDKLSRAVNCLTGRENVPAAYYANAELVDSELNSLHQSVYHGKQFPSLLMTLCCSNIMGCTMVFNRKTRDVFCQRSVEGVHIGMHDYFIAQLCNACGGEIVYDDRVVMQYRQHGRNVVGYQGVQKQSAVKRIIGKITKKNKVTIDRDAQNLLLYEALMKAENLLLVKKVSRYKQSWPIRMELCTRLVCSCVAGRATKRVILGAVRVFLNVA